MTKFLLIRDQHSKIFGHRILNSQLSLYIGILQLLVCLWSLTQHIFSIIALNKILYCDFSSNSSLPPMLTGVDAIIFDVGLFHSLWGIHGCVAQHLDGGYGRFAWCISHTITLIFCLPFAYVSRPKPYYLWPLLIQQSAYGTGLLILSLAALPRVLPTFMGDLSNAPIHAILFYTFGTLMNFFFLYIYWHWYWYVEAMWNSARKIRNDQLQNSHNLRTSAAATTTTIPMLISKNSLCSLDKINGDLTITKLVNGTIITPKESHTSETTIPQKTSTKNNGQNMNKLISHLNDLNSIQNLSGQNSANSMAINSITRTLPKNPNEYWKNSNNLDSSLDSGNLLSRNLPTLNKAQKILPRNSSMGSLNPQQNILSATTKHVNSPMLPQIRKLRLEKTPSIHRSSITSSSEESSINSHSTYVDYLSTTTNNKLPIVLPTIPKNNQKLRMSRQQWSSLSTSRRNQRAYPKPINEQQFISSPRLPSTITGDPNNCISRKISPLFLPAQNSAAYSLYPLPQTSNKTSFSTNMIVEEAPRNFYYQPYEYNVMDKTWSKVRFLPRQVSSFDKILPEAKRKSISSIGVERAAPSAYYYKPQINSQYYLTDHQSISSTSQQQSEDSFSNELPRKKASSIAMEKIATANPYYYNPACKATPQYFRKDFVNPSTSLGFLSRQHSIEKIPEEDSETIYPTRRTNYPKTNISFSGIPYSLVDQQNSIIYPSQQINPSIYEANQQQEYPQLENASWNSSKDFLKDDYYLTKIGFNNKNPLSSTHLRRIYSKSSLYNNSISNSSSSSIVPSNNPNINQRRKQQQQFQHSYSTTS